MLSQRVDIDELDLEFEVGVPVLLGKTRPFSKSLFLMSEVPLYAD